MILYVEDSIGDCSLFAGVMRDFPSIEWKCVTTIAEAKAWLEVHGSQSRLILLDLLLPNGLGIELMQTVKTCAPGVPVVVVTGASSSETTTMALRFGAVALVDKGLNQAKQLRSAVLRWAGA